MSASENNARGNAKENGSVKRSELKETGPNVNVRNVNGPIRLHSVSNILKKRFCACSRKLAFPSRGCLNCRSVKVEDRLILKVPRSLLLHLWRAAAEAINNSSSNNNNNNNSRHRK